MRLTDDLKNKLDTAHSKEEKAAILAETKSAVKQAGIDLEDDEMDVVAGGVRNEEFFRYLEMTPDEKKAFRDREANKR